MSKRSITSRRSKFWLLSLMAVMLFTLMVPAVSFADGLDPDPPAEDPPIPPSTNDSVAPDDDPTSSDGVAPEADSLTKLDILLLTLAATF